MFCSRSQGVFLSCRSLLDDDDDDDDDDDKHGILIFHVVFLKLRIIKSVLLVCQKIPWKIKTNIDDVENLLFVVLFRKPWFFPHHVVCLPIWVKIITQHHPPDVLPWVVQLLRLYAASRGLSEPSAAHAR